MKYKVQRVIAAIACMICCPAMAGTYSLNKNTPFEVKITGTDGLVGQTFFVNKAATYRQIADQVTQGQRVTVTQVKDGSRGVVLIRVSDEQGRPLLNDWYAPSDLGLMTEDTQTKWLAKIRADCGSDALAATARNQQVQVGMSEACATDSWGQPYRLNTTMTAGGASKQMIYFDGYIYSTNGVITAIQQSQ